MTADVLHILSEDIQLTVRPFNINCYGEDIS